MCLSGKKCSEGGKISGDEGQSELKGKSEGGRVRGREGGREGG